MLKILTKYSVYSCLLLLAACFGGGNYAPIIERQERASIIPNHHVVKSGETVYSIAWRYSMGFSQLADANKIERPYTIYPGQQLVIKRAVKSAEKHPKKTHSSVVNNPSAVSASNVVKNSLGEGSIVKAKPQIGNKYNYPFTWKWPARGQVINSYSSSSSVHKGIDIKGKLGESVRAANSGTVVYAGSGLVGYGNLLIIKHSDRYLSAYGHNSKLLVAEAEIVKVGQKIAEFGDTGTDKVKLHFEIRRDGDPVNPLSLLPKK